MSRIEKGSGIEARLDEMQSSVRRSGRGISMPWFKIGCSLFLFGSVFLFFVWLIWMIAATGLVNIPGFTAMAYKEPAPIHAVTSGPTLEEFLAAFSHQGTVSVPESAITSALRLGLSESNQDAINVELAQVAVDSDTGLELFLPFKDNGLKSAMRLQIKVDVVDGAVVPSQMDLWIGNWHVPTFLARMAIEAAVRQAIMEWQNRLGASQPIQSIEYHQGLVTVTTL